MEIEGKVYTDKKAAGSAILEACHAKKNPDAAPLGQYRGFTMDLSFNAARREFEIALKNKMSYSTFLGTDIFGNIQLNLDKRENEIVDGDLDENGETLVRAFSDRER